MFAWRHFPDLNAITLRRDIGKRKPQVKLFNEQCWQRLADLAITLGFESKEAIRLRIQDSDTKMTLEFLRQVRPPESLISRMKFIWNLSYSTYHRGKARNTNETNDLSKDSDIPVEHRCGRPHEGSHENSRRLIFADEIYGPQRQGLSHFAVNRDIFLALFGRQSHLDFPRGCV